MPFPKVIMKFLRQETYWRIEENSNAVFAIVTKIQSLRFFFSDLLIFFSVLNFRWLVSTFIRVEMLKFITAHATTPLAVVLLIF